MNPKHFAVAGLAFLVASQILLLQGSEFLASQRPIDFAHTFMLLGAALLLAFNFIFPKGIIDSIANVLTALGVVAHIGMCTIDFVLWSYGSDFAGRDLLLSQLINTPVIWQPFMVIGPALLYAGLATHSWSFLRSNPLGAIVTLAGSAAIGIGQMVFHNHLVVLIACIIFSVGLLMLIYVVKSEE